MKFVTGMIEIKKGQGNFSKKHVSLSRLFSLQLKSLKKERIIDLTSIESRLFVGIFLKVF